jgi:hypothetical protein
MKLQQIVDISAFPVLDRAFRDQCKSTLDRAGVLVLPNFLSPNAIASIYKEGQEGRDRAYFCKQKHNVYLTEPDPNFASDHPRNRETLSSKGCLCDDVIALDSPLRQLYGSEGFRNFLCTVLSEKALYEYADTLSSINLHYADPGQELGWHFDNSTFAVTLMIEAPEKGGKFEYVRGIRNFDKGELNYKGVDSVLDGYTPVQTLNMQPGALVLFRGRDSLHRVAPVEGLKTRILAVLAYNKEPGIALSKSARQTFFGRIS